MCRIVGFASLNKLNQPDERLQAMVKIVAHGGPDDAGTFVDDHVALGHRRLSIIDLSSSGHQPMYLDHDLIISFNGEVYNYQALKMELEVNGRIFKTQTDTEVILHAYSEWGTNAFDRFEGIFAFALYDKARQKLLLVRDHVGVKPLYYYLANDQLVFGSEVRVFKEFNSDWQENQDWKILFLAFGSIPRPYTTLKNVYRLNPGNFLELNLSDFSYTISEYIQTPPSSALPNSNNELNDVEYAIRNAIKKNLISDAPLGVFLSGGIDSSLITLLADEYKDGIHTLSINFDEATFDESFFQRMVLERTKNVNHTSYRVSAQMFWDALPDILKAMDQPTIDGVNSYFIAKCAHENGLKTVLSGLGADEIFGGYASFGRAKWIYRLRALPFKRSLSNVIGFLRHAYRRLIYLEMPGPIGDYLFLRGIHTPDTIAKLLDISEEQVWRTLKGIKIEVEKKSDLHEYIVALESKIYMTNQLLKDTDCMSMWHGLEVRVPFLDIKLLQLINSIASEKKFKDMSHKHLLTAPFAQVLPSAIRTRKKVGFTFPFQVWLKGNPEKLTELVDLNPVSKSILSQFYKGRKHWSKSWSLAILQQFHQ